MTRDVITFTEDEEVGAAAQTLSKKRITGAPVVDSEGHVVGIVSEVDVLTKRGKTVKEIMSPHAIAVTEATAVEEAAQLLAGKHIRRLPRLRGRNMRGLDSRAAVAAKQSRAWGREVDPETEVTVACGATESMIAAMLAAVDPGDEVIVFEPFYENYGPDCILSGAVPRFVALRPPDWNFDPDELRRAFSPKTRAIVINTPHNPTGKVFSLAELELIAGLCQEHDALALTDEIYEHLVYDGRHLALATLPGMAERTITISGASKTFSVTGWRVGWLIAPPALTAGIRKVHDFLTVGAAHPLQIAVATALGFPEAFYDSLQEEYRERRDTLVRGLREIGFECRAPAGAY